VRQRWLSGRALRLHVALLVWFPGCLIAGWWQVNRAFDGNGLSYLYSVEWPVFALVGVWAWWALLHTDPETVGRRAQERMAAAGQDGRDAGATGVPAADGAPTAGDAAAATGGAATGAGSEAAGATRSQPVRRREEEDEALAAYNDRLAELASRGPQGWRHR
jgi:hypothetical protein